MSIHGSHHPKILDLEKILEIIQYKYRQAQISKQPRGWSLMTLTSCIHALCRPTVDLCNLEDAVEIMACDF